MVTAMPAEEEEDEQPLLQSVALFCCKGMIEGIIVVMFFWLLIQVLFTKELEIHLQILLGAGLVVFCLSLLLGCFLCLWQMRSHPAENKEPSVRPSVHMTTPVDLTSSSSPEVAIKLLCEEPEAESLDYASAFGSSTPSDDDLSKLPSTTRPRVTSTLQEGTKSCFALRRLSSPAISTPLYCPMDRGHRASLPALPRLGFLSRTRKVLEPRYTAAADACLYNERSCLIGPSFLADATPHPPGPSSLALTTLSRCKADSSLLSYGATSSPSPAPNPALRSPSLHFSLCFSAEHQTLTLALLSLSGAAHRLGTVSILAQLPPVRSIPAEVSARHRSLSPELHGPALELAVSSLEELRGCVLRLAVYSQDLPGHTHSPLGQMELDCGELEWKPEMPLTCKRHLSPLRGKTQGGTSHDVTGGGLGSGSLQAPPQLFILMQFQTLAHRLKVMILKAENLPGSGMQDHHVVINLRHAGVVVASRATQGASGCDTVWNTPFLFDLPPGDVTQLPLLLEFILIKGFLYSTSNVVGCAVIGQEADEEGQAHWRDMCTRSQVEVARWHTIQSELR